jgi:hypothetical protein
MPKPMLDSIYSGEIESKTIRMKFLIEKLSGMEIELIFGIVLFK